MQFSKGESIFLLALAPIFIIAYIAQTSSSSRKTKKPKPPAQKELNSKNEENLQFLTNKILKPSNTLEINHPKCLLHVDGKNFKESAQKVAALLSQRPDITELSIDLSQLKDDKHVHDGKIFQYLSYVLSKTTTIQRLTITSDRKFLTENGLDVLCDILKSNQSLRQFSTKDVLFFGYNNESTKILTALAKSPRIESIELTNMEFSKESEAPFIDLVKKNGLQKISIHADYSSTFEHVTTQKVADACKNNFTLTQLNFNGGNYDNEVSQYVARNHKIKSDTQAYIDIKNKMCDSPDASDIEKLKKLVSDYDSMQNGSDVQVWLKTKFMFLLAAHLMNENNFQTAYQMLGRLNNLSAEENEVVNMIAEFIKLDADDVTEDKLQNLKKMLEMSSAHNFPMMTEAFQKKLHYLTGVACWNAEKVVEGLRELSLSNSPEAIRYMYPLVLALRSGMPTHATGKQEVNALSEDEIDQVKSYARLVLMVSLQLKYFDKKVDIISDKILKNMISGLMTGVLGDESPQANDKIFDEFGFQKILPYLEIEEYLLSLKLPHITKEILRQQLTSNPAEFIEFCGTGEIKKLLEKKFDTAKIMPFELLLVEGLKLPLAMQNNKGSRIDIDALMKDLKQEQDDYIETLARISSPEMSEIVFIRQGLLKLNQEILTSISHVVSADFSDSQFQLLGEADDHQDKQTEKNNQLIALSGEIEEMLKSNSLEVQTWRDIENHIHEKHQKIDPRQDPNVSQKSEVTLPKKYKFGNFFKATMKDIVKVFQLKPAQQYPTQVLRNDELDKAPEEKEKGIAMPAKLP